MCRGWTLLMYTYVIIVWDKDIYMQRVAEVTQTVGSEILHPNLLSIVVVLHMHALKMPVLFCVHIHATHMTVFLSVSTCFFHFHMFLP